jgi:CheY-like chemotaxis protein
MVGNILSIRERRKDGFKMARILVIEDELPLLRDLMELLEFSDFEVHGASTGEQGFSAALELTPDLILCDIGLRGSNTDGYMVLDQVRATPHLAETPFVFMSARADPESREIGMSKGANEYLTKPFAAPDLIKTIESLVNA